MRIPDFHLLARVIPLNVISLSRKCSSGTCANFGKNIFHNLGVNLSKQETAKAMFPVFLEVIEK